MFKGRSAKLPDLAARSPIHTLMIIACMRYAHRGVLSVLFPPHVSFHSALPIECSLHSILGFSVWVEVALTFYASLVRCPVPFFAFHNGHWLLFMFFNDPFTIYSNTLAARIYTYLIISQTHST